MVLVGDGVDKGGWGDVCKAEAENVAKRGDDDK